MEAQNISTLYSYYHRENQLVDVLKQELRGHVFGYSEEKAEALSMLLEIEYFWKFASDLDTWEKRRLHVLALAICYCLRVCCSCWQDFPSLVKFLRTVIDRYPVLLQS
jgi:hypothetical protein